MTHDPNQPSLQDVGDALAAATDRDLHRGRRRPVRRIALALAGLADRRCRNRRRGRPVQPEAGRRGHAGRAPRSSARPTRPASSTPDDGELSAARCRSAPANEVTDANGNPAYLGTKEVVAIDGVVAGGCIGLDQAGMTWDCYVGQAAVDHEIISQDFLGEPVLGPGHG